MLKSKYNKKVRTFPKLLAFRCQGAEKGETENEREKTKTSHAKRSKAKQKTGLPQKTQISFIIDSERRQGEERLSVPEGIKRKLLPSLSELSVATFLRRHRVLNYNYIHLQGSSRRLHCCFKTVFVEVNTCTRRTET